MGVYKLNEFRSIDVKVVLKDKDIVIAGKVDGDDIMVSIYDSDLNEGVDVSDDEMDELAYVFKAFYEAFRVAKASKKELFTLDCSRIGRKEY